MYRELYFATAVVLTADGHSRWMMKPSDRWPRDLVRAASRALSVWLPLVRFCALHYDHQGWYEVFLQILLASEVTLHERVARGTVAVHVPMYGTYCVNMSTGRFFHP